MSQGHDAGQPANPEFVNAEVVAAVEIAPSAPQPAPRPPRFAGFARWSWILAVFSTLPVMFMIGVAFKWDPFRPMIWPLIAAELFVSVASIMGLVAFCGSPSGDRSGVRVEAIVGMLISVAALFFVNLGAFGAVGILAARQDRVLQRKPSGALAPLQPSLPKSAPLRP